MEPDPERSRPIDMTTTFTRVAAAVAVPLVALALAGCSSDSAGTADTSTSAGERSTAKAVEPGDAGGSRSDAGGKLADTGADVPAARDASAIQQPSIISTGSVSLATKDVAKARADVTHVAATYGGQVTDQETSTADDAALGYARLVLRVPARSFSDAMADVEEVARLVDSSTTSEDVSNQVIDVDERVKAARASIDRITTLLSRAEKIGDVMAIEAQLASREADLNSLLRQQAHLADQVALATISVSIDRSGATGIRQASDDSGFLAGLSAGWDALRSFGTGVATVVGAVLPWTPIAALIAVPVWLGVRRSRRTPIEAPAPAE